MGRNGESSISELPTLCKERKGWGTRQTGRFLAANRKGGFGGRPELSLVVVTGFARYIYKSCRRFLRWQESTRLTTKFWCGPGDTRTCAF